MNLIYGLENGNKRYVQNFGEKPCRKQILGVLI
jgi:hypothetical protein